MNPNFTQQQLFDFVDLAGKSTYAAGKDLEIKSERKDFIEYLFSQDQWSYLDSYTGHTKSAGQEIVRLHGEIVWTNSYCGGMTEGNESLSNETFTFLIEALSQPAEFQSKRGPAQYKKDNW